MGAALNSVHDRSKGAAAVLTSPSRKDWITLHAELTGLTIIEVERLWRRFVRMDDSGSAGFLSVASLRKSPNFKDDVFMKNLLISLANEDRVQFQAFLNAMKWVSTASSREKSAAMFSFFNQGSNLTKALLGRILKRVYPDKSEEQVDVYTNTLFSALDTSGNGEITQQTFLSLLEQFPQEQLDNVLDFVIIPDTINEEAHQLLSTQWVSQGTMANRDRKEDSIVSSKSLEELSSLLIEVNWVPVSTTLGYTANQLAKIRTRYSDEPDQVLAMLEAWKKRMADDATCGELRDAVSKHHPDMCSVIYA